MTRFIGLFFLLIVNCSWASTTTIPLAIEDSLQVQTILFQSEIYREYKIVIEDAISREEQRLQKLAENWNTTQWHELIDMLIEEKIILAFDENLIDEEQKKFMAEIKNQVSLGLKNVVDKLTTMGRLDGTGPVIAYIGGTAAGYALAGVGVAIGSAGMVSFFSIFPLATVTLSAVLAVKHISDNIKMKKAFNRDSRYDYYGEYKSINKKVSEQLKIIKGDYIYALNDEHGIVIRKKGLISGLKQFLGFNKDKLSLSYLVKALKRENLYLSDLKQIKNSRKLSSVEKIVSMIQYIEKNFKQEDKDLILAHFSKQRVFDLPLVDEMKAIMSWAHDTASLSDMSLLPIALYNAPSDVPFLNIVKVYQDFIIPKLAKRLKGKMQFKLFKCLRSGFFEQTATGAKNVRLLWQSRDPYVTQMVSSVSLCL